MQEMKLKGTFLDSREQSDRDIHQSKTDHSVPDSSHLGVPVPDEGLHDDPFLAGTVNVSRDAQDFCLKLHKRNIRRLRRVG
jgi:hypothetical protein